MGQVIVQLFDFLVRAVVYFVSNSPNAAKEWDDVTAALMGQEAPQPEPEPEPVTYRGPFAGMSLDEARKARQDRA